MNCKKCNAETNGDIFCSSCSDEILKLYLVDKISADEIEKRFSLLPNTVAYWYNYCKGRNGDDFSYLTYNNLSAKTINEHSLKKFYLGLYLMIFIVLLISFILDKILPLIDDYTLPFL